MEWKRLAGMVWLVMPSLALAEPFSCDEVALTEGKMFCKSLFAKRGSDWSKLSDFNSAMCSSIRVAPMKGLCLAMDNRASQCEDELADGESDASASSEVCKRWYDLGRKLRGGANITGTCSIGDDTLDAWCDATYTLRDSYCNGLPSSDRRYCKVTLEVLEGYRAAAPADEVEAPIETSASTPTAAASAPEPIDEEEVEDLVYEFDDLFQYAQEKVDEYEDNYRDAGWTASNSYVTEQLQEWCDSYERVFPYYRTMGEDADPAAAMKVQKRLCPILDRIAAAEKEAEERARQRDRALGSALKRQSRTVSTDAASIAAATGGKKATLVAVAELTSLDIGWRDGGGSDFKQWLSGGTDKISGGLNCYESVAYAAVVAGLTSREKLRSFFYDGGQENADTPEFRAAFGVDSARPIETVMRSGGLEVGDVLFFGGEPSVHTVLSLGGESVISVDDSQGYRRTTLTELAERYGSIGDVTVARNPPLFR